MIMHSNIDKTDAALTTKAPFMGHCKCMLGNVPLSANSILSVKIYLTEGMTPPARISKITKNDMTFTDAVGSFIGTIEFPAGNVQPTADYPYVSACIQNENGVITGHITMQPYAVKELKDAAVASGGTINTEANDFMLLPQCHAASFVGGVRAFKIGSEYITTNTRISLMQPLILHDGVNSKTKHIHLLKKFTPQGKTHGIRLVSVVDSVSEEEFENIDHVLISVEKLSNMRVTMQDGTVVLKGVLDA